MQHLGRRPGANPSPMEETLRHYIATELAPGHGVATLDRRDPLFESALDSTNVLSLVAHLEREFGIEIPDQEVVPSNFGTLELLALYVERKRCSRLSAGGEH